MPVDEAGWCGLATWSYCAQGEAARARLLLGHQVKHWLMSITGGAVERLEFADLDPQALDGEDLGACTPSLAIARSLGFTGYGQNLIARLRSLASLL